MGKLRSTAAYKIKQMLSTSEWADFFREMNVFIKDDRAIDQLLQFAVFKRKGTSAKGGRLSPPKMAVIGSEHEEVEAVEELADAGPFTRSVSTPQMRNGRGSQGTARERKGQKDKTEVVSDNEAENEDRSSLFGGRGSLFETANRTYSKSQSNVLRPNNKDTKSAKTANQKAAQGMSKSQRRNRRKKANKARK